MTLADGMKYKSEVDDLIERSVIQFKSLYKHPIKIIRTDNGSEYVSDRIKELCRQEKIFHERSTPYDHEQLGRAERWNGIVADGTRANLIQSGLPS